LNDGDEEGPEASGLPFILVVFVAAILGATSPNAESSETWSGRGRIDLYLGSEDGPYLQPTLMWDRGALHLEGRYNYEDLDTGSLFVGRAYVHEGAVELEVVPMIGVAMGSTQGAVPAVSLWFAWKRLELGFEAEYVLERRTAESDFYYSWTELAVWATDRLRLGLAEQRTRLRGESSDVAYGLFVGIRGELIGGSVHYFESGDDDRYAIAGIDFRF
jgi:hypothetical protein